MVSFDMRRMEHTQHVFSGYDVNYPVTGLRTPLRQGPSISQALRALQLPTERRHHALAITHDSATPRPTALQARSTRGPTPTASAIRSALHLNSSGGGFHL